jgi:hypothetical protein
MLARSAEDEESIHCKDEQQYMKILHPQVNDWRKDQTHQIIQWAEIMSKTAREAVSEFLLAFQSDRDTIEQGYSDLVTTLGEAGFVILPKRPTAKMIDAVTLWDYANGEGATSDDVAEIYGEMVNAALKE